MSMINLQSSVDSEEEENTRKSRRSKRGSGNQKKKDNKPKKITKFGDARDNPEYKGSRSTMPPRLREGKSYPGGRSLRHRMSNLKRIQSAHNGKPGYKLAGSMNR